MANHYIQQIEIITVSLWLIEMSHIKNGRLKKSSVQFAADLCHFRVISTHFSIIHPADLSLIIIANLIKFRSSSSFYICHENVDLFRMTNSILTEFFMQMLFSSYIILILIHSFPTKTFCNFT